MGSSKKDNDNSSSDSYSSDNNNNNNSDQSSSSYSGNDNNNGSNNKKSSKSSNNGGDNYNDYYGDSNNNKNGGSNGNNNSPSKHKSNSPSTPTPPSSSKGSHSKSHPLLGDGSLSSSDKNNLITGLVVGVGALLLLFIFCCMICCKKKKKRDTIQYYESSSKKGAHQQYGGQNMNYAGVPSSQWGPAAMQPPPQARMSTDMNSGNYSSGPMGPVLPPPHPTVALGFSKSSFTYDELAAATKGFSQDQLLGQGGFGYVHKGVLPNGKEIAVKSLKAGSGQGDREFQAEVEIISRVHHRHLVSLVGYCIAGPQKMLVYEFVPNNTLEFHLHGKGRPVMDFPSRMKIALGSAKGLAYLHEDCHPKIIHRDIKTANILIDNAFEAKVADFGLAKLSSDTNTHVSTRVMGTFGYLAPEYASSGKLTEKSDVFSFGVMLLELVSGRRPIDPYSEEEDSLVDWARPLIGQALDEGNFHGFADPKLEGEFDHEEMMRLIACAGASIRHSAKRRPKMSQIVRALEGDVSLEDLNAAPKPRSGSTLSNSEYDSSSYDNDMKGFRRTALNSSDYTSSEYGGHTSGSSGEFSSKFTSPGPARTFL